MNRRSFIKSAGAFVATVAIVKQLPAINNSSSIVWPNTSYELDDIFSIQWTGLKKSYFSSKLVGYWLAYPKIKYKAIQGTCVQSNVICYQGDDIQIVQEDIQNGLNTLLEIIEKGINIAKQHNIKGCVPVDSYGAIDRRFLSQMRRDHIKLGIWPNQL